MPSIKDLKKRIGSVKNTQQTTKAMKMVSAAKLRRAQEAITSQRPYARQIGQLISLVNSLNEDHGKPLIARNEGVEEGEKKKLLLVVVTSDRGLCGGFNSNIIKSTQRWLRQNEAKYAEITLSFVGRRGHDFFKTKKVKVGHFYSEITGKVVFASAKKLSDSLLEKYVTGEADEIKIIYNEFKNAMSQVVMVDDFLPVAPVEMATAEQAETVSYLIKPNRAEVLARLLEKNFAIQAYRVLLESQAGEHGARMSAMESATKNAGDMIKKLTLQYNKQRQAGITKELLEIISGSESQKNTG